MGLFRRDTNRDAETVMQAFREIAPDFGARVEIVDGQAVVSLPAEQYNFSYLTPRKGLWALFEGITNSNAWAAIPPTTVVVGKLGDDAGQVARKAIEWHGKGVFEKRNL